MSPTALTQIEVIPGVLASVSARGKNGKYTSLMLSDDGYAGGHDSNNTVSYRLELEFSNVFPGTFFFTKRQGDGTIRVLRNSKENSCDREVHFQVPTAVVKGASAKPFLKPYENHVYACLAGPSLGGVLVVCVALVLRHGESLSILSNTTYQSTPHYKQKDSGRALRFPELEKVEHGALPTLATELRQRKLWDANEEVLDKPSQLMVPAFPNVEDWREPEFDISDLQEGEAKVALSSIRQDQYTAILANGESVTIRGKSLGKSGCLWRGDVINIKNLNPNTNPNSKVKWYGSGVTLLRGPTMVALQQRAEKKTKALAKAGQ